jgi:hypothetical protein
LDLSRFAAALIKQPVWVMNIIPISEPDTLPIIYDRGLIGMYHDWCEPHSTYPRTYDLLHANHIISSITNKYFILLYSFSNFQIFCFLHSCVVIFFFLFLFLFIYIFSVLPIINLMAGALTCAAADATY